MWETIGEKSINEKQKKNTKNYNYHHRIKQLQKRYL